MPSKHFVLLLLLYSFYIAPVDLVLYFGTVSSKREVLRRGKHITYQLSEVFLTQFLPKVTLLKAIVPGSPFFSEVSAQISHAFCDLHSSLAKQLSSLPLNQLFFDPGLDISKPGQLSLPFAPLSYSSLSPGSIGQRFEPLAPEQRYLLHGQFVIYSLLLDI